MVSTAAQRCEVFASGLPTQKSSTSTRLIAGFGLECQLDVLVEVGSEVNFAAGAYELRSESFFVKTNQYLQHLCTLDRVDPNASPTFPTRVARKQTLEVPVVEKLSSNPQIDRTNSGNPQNRQQSRVKETRRSTTWRASSDRSVSAKSFSPSAASQRTIRFLGKSRSLTQTRIDANAR